MAKQLVLAVCLLMLGQARARLSTRDAWLGHWSQPQPNHAYSMLELAAEAGYELEEHYVTTDDGYILKLFRIPRGRGETHSNAAKPPVFLQHALLDSSCSWINQLANESLGFILADKGYDVWFGNSRGNTFSKNHTTLSVSDVEFWRFSFDQMAAYDVPASVDYVLKVNGASTLVYVGHSQGTTIGLAAMAQSIKLQAKISLAVLLAPAVYLQHVTSSPARALATAQADKLFLLVGAKEFLPSNAVLQLIFGSVCTLHPEKCANVLSLLCGYNEDNINSTRLGVFLSYTPAGTSVQNMAHWAQAMRLTEPTFPMFDYGTSCRSLFFKPQPCNQDVYGQETPPEYDLDAVRVPIALATGTRDQLADPADTDVLLAKLKHHVVYHHEEPSFEHLDFTWSYKAATLVYPKLLELVDKYSRDATRS